MTISEVLIENKLHRLQGIYNARQIIEYESENGEIKTETIYRYYRTERDRKTLEKILENLKIMKPYWEEEREEREKAVKARARKKSRYKKRIKEMQESYEEVYFVTLTVRKYKKDNQVKIWGRKYLEENCKDYIGNLDYGKKNERCHIHAIVAWNDIHKKWDKGYMQQSRIYGETGRKRTTNYITKLINHANKISSGKIFNKKGTMKEIEILPF